MKKYIQGSLFLIGVVCFVLGSITVIFINNIGVIDFADEKLSVNPSMAVISTIVVLLVGVVMFIRRNKIEKV